MTTRKPRSPAYDHAYTAFSNWMRTPDNKARLVAVYGAMNAYELKYRIQRALPAIPVEEVTFDNPEHRSTRLEFLADCATYGA